MANKGLISAVGPDGKARVKQNNRASLGLSEAFPGLPMPHHSQRLSLQGSHPQPLAENDQSDGDIGNDARSSATNGVQRHGNDRRRSSGNGSTNSNAANFGHQNQRRQPSINGYNDIGTNRNGVGEQRGGGGGGWSQRGGYSEDGASETSFSHHNGHIISPRTVTEDDVSSIASEDSPNAMRPSVLADQLKQHLSSAPHNSSLQRNSSASDLRQLLNILDENLERNTGFVDDFVSSPIFGLSMLIRLLENIQSTRRDESRDSQRRSRNSTHARESMTEIACLQCIGQIVRHREHWFRFESCEGATETVADSSLTSEIGINMASIQVLILICEMPDGHSRVINAISTTNSRSGNIGRLSGYVRLLNAGDLEDHEKATIVRFFNVLRNSAPDNEAKIFLQQELNFAAFDPKRLAQKHRRSSSSAAGDELLFQELESWRENHVDISKFTSVSRTSELERQTQAVRNESQQLRDLLQDSQRKIDDLEENREQLTEKVESYREQVVETHEKVRQLRALYLDRTGCDPEEELNALSRANRSPFGGDEGVRRNLSKQTLLRFGTVAAFRYDDLMLMRNTGRPSSPSYLRKSIRLKMTSHPHLPQINWTPMHAVGSTIFEDMDIEAVIREMDFSELERIFRLPSKLETAESRDRREKVIQRINRKIHFVENNRAKNLIITQRKTGLNPIELKLAIDRCDVTSLPGENAQLFLRYLPLREELQQLSEFSDRYEELGDAERILHQMSRVERLETKLNVMVYIGAYHETMKKLRPDIETLRRASRSVIESDRLKGVLELILVYGNYLNCTRRGCALGYRLDSLAKLSEVKSQDKTITLLHYLVTVVETDFPPLATFYEDLELEGVKSVSNQVIDDCVVMLRKGIDNTRDELHQQPTNIALSAFCSEAAPEVASLDEPYRNMISFYRIVCNLFGENYRLVEPAELFGLLVDFVEAFKRASVENFNRLNPSPNGKQSGTNKKPEIHAAPNQSTSATPQSKGNQVNVHANDSPQRKIKDITNGAQHQVIKSNSSIYAAKTSNDVTKRSNDVIKTSNGATKTSNDVPKKSNGVAKTSSGEIPASNNINKSSIVGVKASSVVVKAPEQSKQKATQKSSNSSPRSDPSPSDDDSAAAALSVAGRSSSDQSKTGSLHSAARSASHSVYYAAVRNGEPATTASTRPGETRPKSAGDARQTPRQLPPVEDADRRSTSANSHSTRNSSVFEDTPAYVTTGRKENPTNQRSKGVAGHVSLQTEESKF